LQSKKHDELRSIAHNVADSLANGIGVLIGVYEMYVFEEANRSKEGYITVDFLSGTTTGAIPSASLADAIGKYRDALPGLCASHGASVSLFRELTAKFASRNGYQNTVLVTIEDQNGRRSTDEYAELPLRRTKELDDQGRVRRKKALKT
jgi:hypothetical protein